MSTDLTMLADAGLSEEQLDRCKCTYRRVGKRDYGIDFDPSAVPLPSMTQLVALMVEWLAESEASNDERKEFGALYSELCDLEMAA